MADRERVGKRLIDYTNLKHGNLRILHRIPNQSGKGYTWNAICDCGNTTSILSTQIRAGIKTSCGCLKRVTSQRTIAYARTFRKIKPVLCPHPDRPHKAHNLCQPCLQRFQDHHLLPEEFESLVRSQANLCALCNELFTEKNPPRIDHDHGCCKPETSCNSCRRGLIHSNCNALLGYAKDDVIRLEQAVNYLKRYQKEEIN